MIFEHKSESPEIIANPPTDQFPDCRQNRPSVKPTVGKLHHIQNTDKEQNTDNIQSTENNISPNGDHTSNNGKKRGKKKQPSFPNEWYQKVQCYVYGDTPVPATLLRMMRRFLKEMFVAGFTPDEIIEFIAAIEGRDGKPPLKSIKQYEFLANWTWPTIARWIPRWKQGWFQRDSTNTSSETWGNAKARLKELSSEYETLVTEYRLLRESQYRTEREEQRLQEITTRLREIKKEQDQLRDRL